MANVETIKRAKPVRVQTGVEGVDIEDTGWYAKHEGVSLITFLVQYNTILSYPSEAVWINEHVLNQSTFFEDVGFILKTRLLSKNLAHYLRWYELIL